MHLNSSAEVSTTMSQRNHAPPLGALPTLRTRLQVPGRIDWSGQELESRSGRPTRPSPEMGLSANNSRSVILLASLAGLASPLGGCQQAPPAEDALPNFLLIDIDTLRADRLGNTSHGESLTPTMDSVASVGTSFANAFSQSGWTAPALASLLTGRYPRQAELVQDGVAWLDTDNRALPTILGYYGYTTAAFWGRTVAGDWPGYGDMFQQQFNSIPPRRELPYLWQAEQWLRRGPPEPWFVFIHDLDLHIPQPSIPPQALHRYVDFHPACPGGNYNHVYRSLLPVLHAAGARAHSVGHYDGAVNYYDRLLGAFLGNPDTAAVLDGAVLVLIADHGEELFERGKVDHGSLYDTVLRIPLIVADPRLEPGGALLQDPVQTVDIAPTILDLAGLPPDLTMDGLSLAPLLRGQQKQLPRRDIYSMTNMTNASVRSGDYKLVMRDYLKHPGRSPDHQQPSPEDLGKPWFELYDLASDPGERHDILEEHPRLASRLEKLLEAWVQQRSADSSSVNPAPLTESQRSTLQERGYWELIQPRAPRSSPASTP